MTLSKLEVPLWTLFIFYIMDFFITHAIIGHTSFAAEGNPITYWLITSFDTDWVILPAKLIFFLFLTLAVAFVDFRTTLAIKTRVTYYLWMLVAVTLTVDIWSIHVLRVVS